jgi:glucoside 3-dehydrogenase (cytochrome c) hitch-hiker subunit
MERREALKLLASAAALPVISRDMFALFRQVHEQMPATAALKTFNAHQDATVAAIADLIIPQTDTPGAKAARVNEFMDIILADWCEDSERANFLSGLADVDVRSRRQFGKDFVDCTTDQQTGILAILDDEATTIREQKLETRRSRRYRRPMEGPFLSGVKRLTLVGYYTSEIGETQELKLRNHFSRYQGCAALEPEASRS